MVAVPSDVPAGTLWSGAVPPEDPAGSAGLARCAHRAHLQSGRTL